MQSFRGQACLEENVWVPYDLLILLKAAVMVHLMEVAGLLKGNFFFFVTFQNDPNILCHIVMVM